MKISFPEPKDITEYKLIEKAKLNDSFRDMLLLKKDISRYILTDIYKKTHSKNPNHRIITIIGETGSGKSLTALTLAYKYITKELGIKNIVFLGEHALEICKKLKENTVIILDEQVMSVGVGSLREAYEMRNLEEVTRKNKLSFIFVSPTPRKHLTSHYNLELFYTDRVKKVNWLAVEQENRYLGYVKIKVNPNWDLWKDYEIEKDKFIDTFLQRKTTRLDYNEMAKKVSKDQRVLDIKERHGKIRGGDLFYIVGQIYPNVTSTERREVMSQMRISFPGLFRKEEDIPKEIK